MAKSGVKAFSKWAQVARSVTGEDQEGRGGDEGLPAVLPGHRFGQKQP